MLSLFLCLFFFGGKLFHHLAFTITMQLGPGFVDTVFNIGCGIGIIIGNNKAFAEGLCQEGNSKQKRCQPVICGCCFQNRSEGNASQLICDKQK